MSAEQNELRERYEVMRNELERLRVRANSPDLSVTVESGPGGGVISVTLSSDALRQSPETLSATITATIRAASGKAAEATRQVVAPLVSDPEAVVSVATGRLPPSEPAAPSVAPRQRADDAEEYDADEVVRRG